MSIGYEWTKQLENGIPSAGLRFLLITMFIILISVLSIIAVETYCSWIELSTMLQADPRSCAVHIQGDF